MYFKVKHLDLTSIFCFHDTKDLSLMIPIQLFMNLFLKNGRKLYAPTTLFKIGGGGIFPIAQGFYASPADIEMDIFKNTSESQMRIN